MTGRTNRYQQDAGEKPALPWWKNVSMDDHKEPIFKYYGFDPSTTVLPKGHVRFPGRRPFPCDVVYERDSAVPLRDGKKLYTDVFRLPGDRKVPAIIHWSPYGKTGAGVYHYDSTWDIAWHAPLNRDLPGGSKKTDGLFQNIAMAPFRAGVPEDKTSGYEKFEGLCPTEWCPRGYAIVNPDARGAFDSEGDLHFWGQQEAEDIYDLIEWLIKQDWCSGSVVMAGNSWLAISQINHAARCPHPALKAIAPWEAFNDPYRDILVRGGMRWLPGFNQLLVGGMAGLGQIENIASMATERPYYDEYWTSKYIHVENIDIPIYSLASYSTGFHTHGSFKAFKEAKSSRKWLRVHASQEWPDLYTKANEDDLQRFYDRYAKGIDNGWEQDTPPVRLSLLGYNGSPAKSIVHRAEREWPLARTEYKKLFLDAEKKMLSETANQDEASTSHEGYSLTDSSDFTFFFAKRTELAGCSKVRLYISCREHDDMDVVVQLRKIGADGKMLFHVNYPVPVAPEQVPQVNTAVCLGPQGALRASHAVTYNSTRSTPIEPFYDHDRSERIEPGTIVPLDIGIWEWGAVFEAGEGIALRIAGYIMCNPEVGFLQPQEPELANKGRHYIHTGGQYDSHLLIPIISG